MSFAIERWLSIALAVALLLSLAHALDFTRRRRLLDKLGDARQLAKMIASLAPARRVVRAVLVVLGATALAITLSHPQVEGEVRWRNRGIDVMVVMDVSKSMLALDVRPNRLQRARLEADRLLGSLEGNRIGVIGFAGGAVHYPLTTDLEAARSLYTGISPADMAPGSDLAGALRLARCLLRPDLERDPDCEGAGRRGHGGDPLTQDEARRWKEQRLEVTELGERARAIVVFTDGEATEGDALEQARKASDAGIAVFVVGVGTAKGAPIPEYDDDGNQRGWKSDGDGQTVMSRLDEEGLRRLAVIGGGEDHYLGLHPTRLGIDPLIKALARLREGDLEARVEKQQLEAYQIWLFPAFMVLLIEACISERRRRPPVEVKA